MEGSDGGEDEESQRSHAWLSSVIRRDRCVASDTDDPHGSRRLASSAVTDESTKLERSRGSSGNDADGGGGGRTAKAVVESGGEEEDDDDDWEALLFRHRRPRSSRSSRRSWNASHTSGISNRSHASHSSSSLRKNERMSTMMFTSQSPPSSPSQSSSHSSHSTSSASHSHSTFNTRISKSMSNGTNTAHRAASNSPVNATTLSTLRWCPASPTSTPPSETITPQTLSLQASVPTQPLVALPTFGTRSKESVPLASKRAPWEADSYDEDDGDAGKRIAPFAVQEKRRFDAAANNLPGREFVGYTPSMAPISLVFRCPSAHSPQSQRAGRSVQAAPIQSAGVNTSPSHTRPPLAPTAKSMRSENSGHAFSTGDSAFKYARHDTIPLLSVADDGDDNENIPARSSGVNDVASSTDERIPQIQAAWRRVSDAQKLGSRMALPPSFLQASLFWPKSVGVASPAKGSSTVRSKEKHSGADSERSPKPTSHGEMDSGHSTPSTTRNGAANKEHDESERTSTGNKPHPTDYDSEDVPIELEVRDEHAVVPLLSVLPSGQPVSTENSWGGDGENVPRCSDVSSSSSSSSLLPSVSSASTWMSVSNSTVHARQSMFDLSQEGSASASTSEIRSTTKRHDANKRGDLSVRHFVDVCGSVDSTSTFAVPTAAEAVNGSATSKIPADAVLERNDACFTPRERGPLSDCKGPLPARAGSVYEHSHLDLQPSFFAVSLPSSRLRKEKREWKSRELFSPFTTTQPESSDNTYPLVSRQSDSSDSARSSMRDQQQQQQSNRHALGTSPLVFHASYMPPMWTTSTETVAARSHRSTGSGDWRKVSKTKRWIGRLLGRRQKTPSSSASAGIMQLQLPDAFQEFTPLPTQRSFSRTTSPLIALSPLTASIASAEEHGLMYHASDPSRHSRTASGASGEESRRSRGSFRWISPLLDTLHVRKRRRTLLSPTRESRNRERLSSPLEAPLLFSNDETNADADSSLHIPVVYLAYSTPNGVAHRPVSMATVLSNLSQWHTQQEKEKEAMRYILGVAQLLFIPDAIQEEEVELRHYISNINRLRHYAVLPIPLPVSNGAMEIDAFTLGNSLANAHESQESPNHSTQPFESVQQASTAETVNHTGDADTALLRRRRQRSVERRARTSDVQSPVVASTNESVIEDNSGEIHDSEGIRLLQRAEESLEEISSLLKAKREKHARRIASLKTFSVLLSMFLPTATLLGVSLLTSAVAVSGSIMLVVVCIAAALSHWISVRCFHMCFSMNHWPSGEQDSRQRSPVKGHRGEGNGWLLTNSSLLCLAEWSGGAGLRRTLLFLMCGTYLTCAIMLQCVGSTLLSGGVQMQQFLVDYNLMDRVPTQDLTPPQPTNATYHRYESNDAEREKGIGTVDPCVFDSRSQVISYAPIILLFLCLPQPPLGGWLKYARYWDTQLFRFVTLGVLLAAALHVVLIHVVYVLSSGRMLIANAAREFPFLIARDSFGRGLSWLRDNESALVALFNALRGRDGSSSNEANPSTSEPETFTLTSAVSFLLLHFSLSTAAIAWLLVPSVFIIRSGTYHLFMVPLLWRVGNRRPASQPQYDPDTVDEDRHPNQRLAESSPSSSSSGRPSSFKPAGIASPISAKHTAHSLHQTQGGATVGETEVAYEQDVCVSPFYATGFGYRFRVGFALLIVVAVLCAALLLVDTTADSQAFAAPLALRLLWTATSTKDAVSHETVEVCSLGNQWNHPVLVLRFTALTAFAFGLVLCAWVPYFITAASSLIAQEGTGSHPRLTSTTVANSVWSALMQRIRPTHRDPASSSTSNPSQHQHQRSQLSRAASTSSPATSKDLNQTAPVVVDIRPIPEPSSSTQGVSGGTHAPVAPDQLYQTIGRERRAPAGACSALQRCPKPLTALRHALRRHGGMNTASPDSTSASSSSIIRLDSVSSIFQFFQSLRCSATTLHEQATVTFLAEFILLRLPFLVLTLLLSALVLSGKTARCYAYWEFWNMGKTSSIDYVQHPECADISTKIAAPLFGRIFLVAALGGGFFLAPILFHVMPFIVYRDALQRYVHCVELQSTTTEVSATIPGGTAAHEHQVHVGQEPSLPSLAPREVESGVEGMQHFVSIQGGPNTTISSRLERAHTNERGDGYVRADEHEMVFASSPSRDGRGAPDGVRRRNTNAQPFAVRALMFSQANQGTRVVPSVVHHSPLTVLLQQRWHQQQSEDAARAQERQRLLSQLSSAGATSTISLLDSLAMHRAANENLSAQRVEAALRSLDSKERRARRRRFAASFVRTTVYALLMITAHLIGVLAFLGALRACDALFLQLRTHKDS